MAVGGQAQQRAETPPTHLVRPDVLPQLRQQLLLQGCQLLGCTLKMSLLLIYVPLRLAVIREPTGCSVRMGRRGRAVTEPSDEFGVNEAGNSCLITIN